MRVPAWKFKREMKRLGSQLNQIPWLLFASAIRRISDNYISRYVQITEGACPMMDSAAILLIFQPDGIQRSTFDTLQHLADNGFSPVLVSNSKLSDIDLDKLKAVTNVIIQRPNFGYDFGGYRQGIMYLLQKDVPLENILVINDSIWFPIKQDCNFLLELKHQNSDMYGLVLNNQYKSKKRHHIQSYLFNFNKRIINSEEFIHYWRYLFLSNNKNAVIRQCEIKMTEYFRSRGFSIGSKYTIDDIYKNLPELSTQDLTTVINYQMIVDSKRRKIITDCRTVKQEGSDEYLIRHRLLGKYFLIAHPIILLKMLNCPAIKKDRQFVYQVQRREIFKDNLDQTLLATVREEMLLCDGLQVSGKSLGME